MSAQDILPGFAGWRMVTDSKTPLQIEFRKKFGDGDMLLIVNDGGGYDYKHYSRAPDKWGHSTAGKAVHISANGPLQLTLDELFEVNSIVTRANLFLRSI